VKLREDSRFKPAIFAGDLWTRMSLESSFPFQRRGVTLRAFTALGKSPCIRACRRVLQSDKPQVTPGFAKCDVTLRQRCRAAPRGGGAKKVFSKAKSGFNRDRFAFSYIHVNIPAQKISGHHYGFDTRRSCARPFNRRKSPQVNLLEYP